jgi:hypothetical protein
MAEFYEQFYSQPRKLVLQDYYEATLMTEKHRFKEIRCCTRIQAQFRCHRLRKAFLIMRANTVLVQRIIRGYSTRKRYWQLIEAELTRRRKAFYTATALSIQRVYRGYYSRKYIHDFYARKTYLMHIAQKNAEVRERLAKHHEGLQLYEAQQKDEYARSEFQKLATSLHHLTSTRAVPGVYAALEEVSDFGKHS